jgi:tetratricopeptide (TPR) repeat protein
VLLADLIAHEERLPVFIVATMRPVDDQARQALLAQLEELAPIERLQLDELSRSEARELAEKLLPGGAASKLEAIAADAGGHPLLLHELAHHAATSRATATRGATLDEMLAARIDRLDELARRLLEIVAVSGGPVTQEVAALAAGMSGADRVKAANILRAAHLARTDGVRHSDRIVSYHDRVREHLDTRLDRDRRRQIHDRLALALEQTGAADHEPRALVRHARAAGRNALAAKYARAAARRAVDALAFDQAAEFFADAIELGDHDPGTRRELQLELATALMHAGRGPESAETFMAAADSAEPAVRLDCQRQAAHQWIITGHLERGMAAVDSSLADINEPPAASPRRAVARVLWNRARLRLRGTRYKKRRPGQVPVETLRRLDVLRAVAHGLAMVDNIRGADFNGRFLLLALRTGEPHRLVGAMAAEVVFLASQGGRAGKRARRLHQRLVQLVEDCPDDPYARTWVLLADGAASFFEGRFRPALTSLARTEEIFAEGPRGLTYEKNNGRVFRVHTLRMLGAMRQHHLLINELVRTGRQRGDRYLETTLELLHGQSLLARGDVAEARRAIDEATWTPPEHDYHLQHWYELLARAELALYTGDAAAAVDRLAEPFAALDRSMLLRVELVRCEASALRGRLLVAAAAARPSAELTREAARIARKLERAGIGYATVFARLLRAALARIDGDDDATVAQLQRAIEAADECDMALHRAAARAHLGALLAGDSGAALRAAAADYATEHGIADPAQMFDLVAPGLRR